MDSKLNKATKALSNGEPARAKRVLEQILRSDPENVEALWMIARLLERRGENLSGLRTTPIHQEPSLKQCIAKTQLSEQKRYGP